MRDATTAIQYGIEILSDATAAESLGFVQNQTAGVFGADERMYSVVIWTSWRRILPPEFHRDLF